MKTIITLDNANKPYGYPQLNQNSHFDDIISDGNITGVSLNISTTISGGTLYGDGSNLTGINSFYLPLSGGTVTGTTNFTNILSATTISGNTIYLPTADSNFTQGIIRLGSYNSITIYNNSNLYFGSTPTNSGMTGTRNVSIGAANPLIYSGSDNIAIGLGTNGYSNFPKPLSQLTGSTYQSNSNIAIGSLSLYRNDTGSTNTAIGYYSMIYNLYGNNNTAIGSFSMGSTNAFPYAMVNSFNSALGDSSLFSILVNSATGITPSSYNTGIGSSSLLNASKTSYNTSVGALSLTGITTGNTNTALGYNTGIGITTGSYNTILGANVSGLSATLSNTIILSDGQGNQRITIPNTGNVLIGYGLTDAGYKLDVNGTTRFNGSSSFIGTITQPVTAGTQMYYTTLTPQLNYTSSGQTNTAFRILPTFSGSTTGLTPTNVIADFGANGVGSQLVVTDVTTGSTFLVNDVSGLPIAEATSTWDFNIYNYPTKVFQKTGTNININGTLNVTGATKITAGFYSTSAYTGSFTDGIVVDYVTGNGRISVGTADSITFYNGGVANTALMTISTGGTVSVTKVNTTTGSTGSSGVVTLTGGTATVSNTLVTSNSIINLTHQNTSGTLGFLYVSSKNAGTSFTITSSSNTDTSIVGYLIIN